MLTYQDLVNVGENESNRMDFVMNIIHQHKVSDDYKIGAIAEEYYKKRNVTLVKFQKVLTTLTGGRVVDKWSPNHKVVSGFFKRFVTQQNQYSLGNGISWGDNPFADDKQKARFDSEVKQAGLYALIGGVSYGCRNLDDVDVIGSTELRPR